VPSSNLMRLVQFETNIIDREVYRCSMPNSEGNNLSKFSEALDVAKRSHLQGTALYEEIEKASQK
jgi:hypothetical protein